MSADQWLKKWKGLDGGWAPGDHRQYKEEARLRRVAKRKDLYLVKLRGGASQDVGGEYVLVRKGSGMGLDRVRETIEAGGINDTKPLST